MKKFSIIITIMLSLVFVLSGCGGGSPATTDPVKTEPGTATENPPVGTEANGTVFDAERFTIVVPEGWEFMDVEGGLQIYKMSGEVIEVHYRGSNQIAEAAKQQAEYLSEMYKGTEPKEVDLLGKKFWMTSFTAAEQDQTSYLRMEDGVMFAIKCAEGNYETAQEFEAILNSIVFK